MIIGVCGKSGSGKSTVAQYIVQYYDGDAIHLDIDKIGHYVLTIPEVQQELINAFGKNIIVDGKVDRRILGVIVFSSPNKMEILTRITWLYMEREIDKVLEENKDKVVILDWLLLPKTKFFEMCDFKILLDIPYSVRKERAMMRDNITSEAFDLRDSSSITYDNSKFDYIITTGDEKEIKGWVKLL